MPDARKEKKRITDLRSWIDALLASWYESRDPHKVTGLQVPQYVVIYGCVSRCHDAARSALLLLDQGYILDALTLTRVCWENALTAQWTLLSDDGAYALANESDRQRLRLIESASLAFPGSEMTPPVEIVEALTKKLRTSTNRSARVFEQLCKDLEPDGAQAYIIFRFLSEYGHASAAAANRYATVKDGKPVLLEEARYDDHDIRMALSFILPALIWAGQASDQRMKGHPRRSLLKRTAREAGLPLELSLSGIAWARQQHAARDARRGTADE